MIEFSRVLLVGRHEPPSDGPDVWIRDAAGVYEAGAQQCWFRRWPDQLERWDEWNAMALIGPFGKWNLVEFHEWEGLGTRLTPVLRGRIQYVPAVDTIDPQPVTGFDPPVLHNATKLLPMNGRIPGDAWTPFARKSWLESARTIEDQLERRGLYNFPESGTLRGWERLLSRESLSVTEKGSQITLVDRRQLQGVS